MISGMTQVSAKRLAAILALRDQKYAALRVLTERVRDAHARLASVKAARSANAAQLELSGNLGEIERLKVLLRQNDEQAASLDAAYRDAQDMEHRAKSEWQAAAGLAEACERHAERHGVRPAPPAELFGPDLTPPAHARIA